MFHRQRTGRRIAFQPSGAITIADLRFPGAVAGEDYERFTRATWRQAEGWFHRHAHGVSDPDLGMHDAQVILLSIAATDLGRTLYRQEERLLSELLQRLWPSRRTEPAPEIPSFLVRAPLSA